MLGCAGDFAVFVPRPTLFYTSISRLDDDAVALSRHGNGEQEKL